MQKKDTRKKIFFRASAYEPNNGFQLVFGPKKSFKFGTFGDGLTPMYMYSIPVLPLHSVVQLHQYLLHIHHILEHTPTHPDL